MNTERFNFNQLNFITSRREQITLSEEETDDSEETGSANSSAKVSPRSGPNLMCSIDSDEYQDIEELDSDISTTASKLETIALETISTLGKQFEVVFCPENNPIPIVQLKERLSNVDVAKLNAVGSGRFKSVYKSSLLVGQHEEEIAIATMKPKKVGEHVMAWLNEKEIIRDLISAKVEGILSIYGILKISGTEHEYLVSKLCKGNLEKCGGELNQTSQLEAFEQAWGSVSNLHKAGFVHRDIKSSNFLLDDLKSSGFKIYVSDFGLTSKLNKLPKGSEKNFAVLDPWSYKRYKDVTMKGSDADISFLSDPRSDTWSFGMMICQLLRNSDPELSFDCDNKEEVEYFFDNWTHNDTKRDPKVNQKIVEEFINKTPFGNQKELKELVQKMMAYDPADRPSDEYVAETLKKLKL